MSENSDDQIDKKLNRVITLVMSPWFFLVGWKVFHLLKNETTSVSWLIIIVTLPCFLVAAVLGVAYANLVFEKQSPKIRD